MTQKTFSTDLSTLVDETMAYAGDLGASSGSDSNGSGSSGGDHGHYKTHNRSDNNDKNNDCQSEMTPAKTEIKRKRQALRKDDDIASATPP